MHDGDTDRIDVPGFEDTDVVIVSQRLAVELEDTEDQPIPPPASKRASTQGDWPPEPRQPARAARHAHVYRIVAPFVLPRE